MERENKEDREAADQSNGIYLKVCGAAGLLIIVILVALFIVAGAKNGSKD